MANRYRGEIEAQLNGERYTLCLTLGALAELETAFAAENLLELATRFETGKLRAKDLVCIIAAGLRGAGHDISDEAVAAMKTPRGAAGFAAIAADLLTATFSPAAAQARGQT